MTSSSIVSMRFFVSGPVFVMHVGEAADHAARAELLLERRVLEVVGFSGLFRISDGRGCRRTLSKPCAVGASRRDRRGGSAELAGHVALGLEQRGDVGSSAHALGRAGQADLVSRFDR